MPATSEITRTLTGEIVVRVTAIGATDARALLAAARTGTPALRKAAATAATNLTHLPARPGGVAAAPVGLTGRQLQVLRLAALGLPDKQIAARLHLSQHTVKQHQRRIRKILAARDRAHAVATAFRTGLLHAHPNPADPESWVAARGSEIESITNLDDARTKFQR